VREDVAQEGALAQAALADAQDVERLDVLEGEGVVVLLQLGRWEGIGEGLRHAAQVGLGRRVGLGRSQRGRCR